MSFHASPAAFAPLVPTSRPTTDKSRVSPECPPELAAQRDRVQKHAETELRAATGAVESRRAADISRIHAREAAGAPRAETQALYEAAYTRQKAGEAQVKAVWGLGEEAEVRKEAEEAARSAIAAVWERHLAQLEERFGL